MKAILNPSTMIGQKLNTELIQRITKRHATTKRKAHAHSNIHRPNLMHDLVTGHSMSGIIDLLNQTPIQWFTKKQNTVETVKI